MVLDAMTYAGNLENLHGTADRRGRIVRGDIGDRALVTGLLARTESTPWPTWPPRATSIARFRAREVFAETNVVGTSVLLRLRLEHARRMKVRFLQVSTDEVYGSLGPTGCFTEDDAAGSELARIRPPRRRATCWRWPTTTPSACRRSPHAPTTTAPTSSPRS